jgi:hypothetical protein
LHPSASTVLWLDIYKSAVLMFTVWTLSARSCLEQEQTRAACCPGCKSPQVVIQPNVGLQRRITKMYGPDPATGSGSRPADAASQIPNNPNSTSRELIVRSAPGAAPPNSTRLAAVDSAGAIPADGEQDVKRVIAQPFSDPELERPPYSRPDVGYQYHPDSHAPHDGSWGGQNFGPRDMHPDSRRDWNPHLHREPSREPHRYREWGHGVVGQDIPGFREPFPRWPTSDGGHGWSRPNNGASRHRYDQGPTHQAQNSWAPDAHRPRNGFERETTYPPFDYQHATQEHNHHSPYHRRPREQHYDYAHVDKKRRYD